VTGHPIDGGLAHLSAAAPATDGSAGPSSVAFGGRLTGMHRDGQEN
jgi:hypothetical protein